MTKQYGSKTAVDKVSCRIDRGAFVGVIGRSGAGKSTLLRMINRLAEPTSGRIVFDGRDVTRLKGQASAGLAAAVGDDLSAVQSCRSPRRADQRADRPHQSRLSTARTLLQAVAGRGSRHRALGARAASTSPILPRSAPTRSRAASSSASPLHALSCRSRDLLLADEPIASLDPRNTRVVMDALLRINKHFGITVLCNLHSLDTARAYCDRLIGMAAGAPRLRRRARRADRRRRARALRSRGGRGDRHGRNRDACARHDAGVAVAAA